MGRASRPAGPGSVTRAVSHAALSSRSGPQTSLERAAGRTGRNGRLGRVVLGLHRCRPKNRDSDDGGTRKPDVGRDRAAEQRGADDDEQHARKQEPRPPASPQGPRQARRPAAGGLAGRGCGQAQRSWNRGHRWTVTVPAPRPPGHLCSTTAIRCGHKARLRANTPLGSCGGPYHTDRRPAPGRRSYGAGLAPADRSALRGCLTSSHKH